ncbi:uncharacterized protein MYCFIDRAFT_180751 [Pseudocercospora fijiensis CIRAD86]|uniref:Uncharacterized protein n=1 Tax=Pseudocercospora fijiensis (strain CIRAD86) TaxID=383855 RepID=M2YG39_PSEFD|nr:uncharacterized protein MYCFIDRAFT_180751 [Pseudocercospora fijiensis CIRAD86]EME76765.1 hypothetical protein MYCFIDRAFT_180751 [Pseudocercospora fijiensis CIRAD86]
MVGFSLYEQVAAAQRTSALCVSPIDQALCRPIFSYPDASTIARTPSHIVSTHPSPVSDRVSSLICSPPTPRIDAMSSPGWIRDMQVMEKCLMDESEDEIEARTCVRGAWMLIFIVIVSMVDNIFRRPELLRGDQHIISNAYHSGCILMSPWRSPRHCRPAADTPMERPAKSSWCSRHTMLSMALGIERGSQEGDSAFLGWDEPEAPDPQLGILLFARPRPDAKLAGACNASMHCTTTSSFTTPSLENPSCISLRAAALPIRNAACPKWRMSASPYLQNSVPQGQRPVKSVESPLSACHSTLFLSLPANPSSGITSLPIALGAKRCLHGSVAGTAKLCMSIGLDRAIQPECFPSSSNIPNGRRRAGEPDYNNSRLIIDKDGSHSRWTCLGDQLSGLERNDPRRVDPIMESSAATKTAAAVLENVFFSPAGPLRIPRELRTNHSLASQERRIKLIKHSVECSRNHQYFTFHQRLDEQVLGLKSLGSHGGDSDGVDSQVAMPVADARIRIAVYTAFVAVSQHTIAACSLAIEARLCQFPSGVWPLMLAYAVAAVVVVSQHRIAVCGLGGSGKHYVVVGDSPIIISGHLIYILKHGKGENLTFAYSKALWPLPALVLSKPSKPIPLPSKAWILPARGASLPLHIKLEAVRSRSRPGSLFISHMSVSERYASKPGLEARQHAASRVRDATCTLHACMSPGRACSCALFSLLAPNKRGIVKRPYEGCSPAAMRAPRGTVKRPHEGCSPTAMLAPRGISSPVSQHQTRIMVMTSINPPTITLRYCATLSGVDFSACHCMGDSSAQIAEDSAAH